MPTPVQHLALAEDILRGGDLPPAVNALLSAQRGPFLLGHTAPDVQTIGGQAREETHFYSVTCTPPLQRKGNVPAHEALFAAHPALARAEALPPAQAAFVAGYTAHLLLDELWLDEIFFRYFAGQEWGTLRERSFLHNVLRTWVDRQDLQRLNGNISAALREAEPRGWLPFVSDEHLCAWRDWLVEQLGPGQTVQTAEVFARRMDVPVAEMEIILRSPQHMEEHVFSHIPRAVLQAFHDAGYAHSVALIARYIDQKTSQPTDKPATEEVH